MEPPLKTIASRDNALYRTLRQLTHDGAARRAAGLAVLEGVHLCQAAIAHGVVPRYCAVGRSSLAHREVGMLVDSVEQQLPPSRRVVLEDALFDAVSQVEQGVAILFVIAVPQVDLPARIDTSCVMLDRIQDPGNVGSILRSAAAAGIGAAYASRGCAGAWSAKVLRAAMGAHFHLRIHEECDLLALASHASIPRIATSPSATRSIYEFDLDGDVAWMFGHEGQGLAMELMRDATALCIPQAREVESLNVAASAAVCFFEQMRQRRQRDAATRVPQASEPATPAPDCPAES